MLSHSEIPIELVCFVLTDPTINFLNKDDQQVQLSIPRFIDLFERKYKEFIKARISLLDIENQYKRGGPDITGILYDEDVMFLTKPYHDCYEDSDEN